MSITHKLTGAVTCLELKLESGSYSCTRLYESRLLMSVEEIYDENNDLRFLSLHDRGLPSSVLHCCPDCIIKM